MNTKHVQSFTFFMLAIFTGAMFGCGGSSGPTYTGPTGTAQGKVTFKGQPVTEGQVAFFSPPISAVGDIQSDGSYTLKWQGRSSIPVGDYKVYIEPPRPQPAPGEERPTTISHPSIPEIYQLAATSDLTASVKEGENSIPLDMK